MNSATITSQATNQATPNRPKCDDCPGAAHPMCCTNTLNHPEPTATVPGQPWRTMSTVERDLPQWLRDTMNGTRRSNGTFSGRGGK